MNCCCFFGDTRSTSKATEINRFDKEDDNDKDDEDAAAFSAILDQRPKQHKVIGLKRMMTRMMRMSFYIQAFRRIQLPTFPGFT